MAGEADLVAAGLHPIGNAPSVRSVGQHLATDEGFDAALFQEWYLPNVAQVGIRLVLCSAIANLPATVAGNSPRSGSATLVDSLDDWRCCLGALGLVLERADFLGRVSALGVYARES